MYKVGLVEDEEALNKLIKNYLEKEDFIVETFTKGQDALDFINDKNNVNLWILDIMLADDVTGYDIIKAIRLQDEEVPIIFSSARDQSIDKIMGLELGCDDYIAKPYRVKELLTRIAVILRRQKYNSDTKEKKEETEADIIFGHTRLDNRLYKIYQKERNVDCTPSEFRLLKELVTHADQVLTRKQLIERLWDVDEAFVDDNTLSVYIKRLRDKLEEDAVYIQTVRGIGYTFSLGNSTNK